MTVAFIDCASAYSASTTNNYLSVAIPTTMQPGDILIAFAASSGSGSPSLTTAGNWTAVPQIGTQSGGAAAYYIITTAAMQNSSVFFGVGNPDSAVVVVAIYRSIVPGPVDVAGISYDTVTTPSLTASETSELVVSLWVDAGSAAGQSPPTITAAGPTSRSSGPGYLVADSTQANPGATSPVTATVSGSSYAPAAATMVVKVTNAPPNPPALTSPPNASYLDAGADAVPFAAVYSDNEGYAQNAYALRIKASGAGAYSYWNASTNALQSTIVWNAISTPSGSSFSVSVPASVLSDGNTYNWSMASQAAAINLQGQFAPDFTFTAQAAPTLTVTGPLGTQTYSNDVTVVWTCTPAAGAQQTAYRLVVEHGAFGAVPGSGIVDWDTKVVASLAQEAAVGVPLPAGTYRAFVQVTETGGQTSAWQFTTFSISLDEPAVPTVTALGSSDPSTGAPLIAVTVNGHDNLLSTLDASSEGGIGSWVGDTNTTLAETSAAADDGSQSFSMTAVAAGSMSATCVTYSL